MATTEPNLSKGNDMGRLTHCPETGIDLNTVGIRKHAERLWPSETLQASRNDPRTDLARERKAALLAEAEIREREAATTTKAKA